MSDPTRERTKDPFHIEARKAAGFTDQELQHLYEYA